MEIRGARGWRLRRRRMTRAKEVCEVQSSKFDLSEREWGNNNPRSSYSISRSAMETSKGSSIFAVKAQALRDLSNNNLAGGIPYSLPPNLTRPDLFFNSLTGNLPESFSPLTSMNSMKNDNSWSSGSAPLPLHGTPPAGRNNRNCNSGGGSSSNGGEGDKKSRIGGGAIAGIVTSLLIVGGIVAFFLIKKRSKKSANDIEKIDNEHFAPLASNEVQGNAKFVQWNKY